MSFDPTGFTPVQANAPVAPSNSSSTRFDPTGFKPIASTTTPASPEPSIDQTVAGNLHAGIVGAAQGAMDAGADMGHLARTILSNTIGKIAPQSVNDAASKAGNALGSAYSKGQEAFRNAPSNVAAEDAHPAAYGVGGGLGYAAGAALGNKGISAPIQAVVDPALEAAAPMTMSRPAIQGALSQGIQGGVIGAAADPEHPIKGALAGAALTAPLGYIGGKIGYQMQRGGDIVKQEISKAIDSGLSPTSHDTFYAIKTELKSEGINLRRLDIKTQIKQQINDQMNKIRPNGYDPVNQSPINTVAEQATKNFPQQLQISKDLYKPVNENTQTFQAPNFNKVLDNVKTDMPTNVAMPKTPLPENATVNDMLSYRKTLDSTIKQAKTLASTGKIQDVQVGPYLQVRNALNQDIQESATNAGIGPQLAAAEDHYNTQIRPFQVYNKNLGQFKLMEDGQMQNKIWQNLNRQFTKRMPDPNAIKQAAQTLGPEGQSQVGWAMLENAYKKSLTGGDIQRFDPQKFATQLDKYKSTGLSQIVFTKDHLQVASGISKSIDSGKQMLKLMTPTDDTSPPPLGFLDKRIVSLLHSAPGIDFLKVIGGSNTSSTIARSMIQQLVTGIIGASAGKIDPRGTPNGR
jgi:hypothetical protein